MKPTKPIKPKRVDMLSSRVSPYSPKGDVFRKPVPELRPKKSKKPSLKLPKEWDATKAGKKRQDVDVGPTKSKQKRDFK